MVALWKVGGNTPAAADGACGVVLAETAALAALIEPVVRDLGFDLVRVQLTGTGARTLQVMAEDRATGQLTLDQCATLSRRLSDVLDEADPIDSEYALEVSSPGIDRPLTRLADFVRWLGHEARFKLDPAVDGRKAMKGTLMRVEGESIAVEVAKTGTFSIPFASIVGAKLVLTDKLLKATRPLSTEGADDIIETDGLEATPIGDNDNDED